ncbi:hypothetical protein SPONN_2004 [uncultured Candidatus Thioglobus sp.]|nr:hypothetical protein SPONN_2004 [uncultured Candidatus Thioglobus sp.]
MINAITIENFRQIEKQTIQLRPITVLVGPNNSGKTSFLQAFSLLSMAIKAWADKRLNNPTKKQQRTGVAINLSDMSGIPAASFKELWTNTKVKQGTYNKKEKKTTSTDIIIKIHAEGSTYDKNNQLTLWSVGFEFRYSRDSVIYTRLMEGCDFDTALLTENIGLLPAISGLNPQEDKLELGSILRKIGEGNTADVLRNICYHLYTENKQEWQFFTDNIKELFNIAINEPQHFQGSGLLELTYNENNNKKMSLSSLGSGAKQGILLFAYLAAFKNTVRLLDEPDAHLEVIKQADVYRRLSEFAQRNNSQIIIASHSESVLNAATNDLIISSMFGKFKPESPQAIKPFLADYGFEQFILARQKPRILYYEGHSDLNFIKAFCKKLQQEDYTNQLDNGIYPYAIGNNLPNLAKKHFQALKQHIPELKGFALFDNLGGRTFQDVPNDLEMYQWQRKEIENYLPVFDTLKQYATDIEIDLFSKDYLKILMDILSENTPPAALDNLAHQFWYDNKMSDFLTNIFKQFLQKTNQPPNTMEKSKFYLLVDYVNVSQIDDEFTSTLRKLFAHLK